MKFKIHIFIKNNYNIVIFFIIYIDIYFFKIIKSENNFIYLI
jgi:hypothetical protein